MLNAIGLANPGRERFLDDTLPRLRELGVPLWISVGGFCAQTTPTPARRSTTSRRSSSTSRARTSTRRPSRLPRSSPRVAQRRRCRSTRSSPPRTPTSRTSRAPSPTQVPTACRSSTRCAAWRSIRARSSRCLRAARAVSPARRSSRSRSPPCTHVMQRPTADRRHGRSHDRAGRVELIACGAQHVALGTILFSDPDAPRRVRDELPRCRRASTTSAFARRRRRLHGDLRRTLVVSRRPGYDALVRQDRNTRAPSDRSISAWTR